jgi:predicted dehydrogenase
MAALAAENGVRTVVGLQARQAPAIEFVQELLHDGYVGEVLSTTMVGLSVAGDVVGQPNAYMLDRTNGANVVTIAAGHSLDVLAYVLGEFADLSAVSDLRRPLITIRETGGADRQDGGRPDRGDRHPHVRRDGQRPHP